MTGGGGGDGGSGGGSGGDVSVSTIIILIYPQYTIDSPNSLRYATTSVLFLLLA